MVVLTEDHCCTYLEKLFSWEFCLKFSLLHYQEVDNRSKTRKNNLFTQKKKEDDKSEHSEITLRDKV
jgi:hypothetical protein